MPTVTLELTNELAQKLQRQSVAQGLDIAKVALAILDEELFDPATTTNPNDRPYNVWRERFHAMLKDLPSVDVEVDDSRESIYEGRGE